MYQEFFFALVTESAQLAFSNMFYLSNMYSFNLQTDSSSNFELLYCSKFFYFEATIELLIFSSSKKFLSNFILKIKYIFYLFIPNGEPPLYSSQYVCAACRLRISPTFTHVAHSTLVHALAFLSGLKASAKQNIANTIQNNCV